MRDPECFRGLGLPAPRLMSGVTALDEGGRSLAARVIGPTTCFGRVASRLHSFDEFGQVGGENAEPDEGDRDGHAADQARGGQRGFVLDALPLVTEIVGAHDAQTFTKPTGRVWL